MVIFRFIGLLLITLALMLLGADLVSTLESNGGTVIRSLDRILLLLHFDPDTWLQQKLPPQLARAVITVLSWPGWLVLGVPGALLGMIPSGQRRPYAPPPPPPIRR